mgnify:FL=1
MSGRIELEKARLLKTLDNFRFHGLRVPGHDHQGIVDYLVDGTPLGDFLKAIAENNLMRAVSNADSSNLRNHTAVGAWFYNEAPSAAWGSEERYTQWVKQHEHIVETTTDPMEEDA